MSRTPLKSPTADPADASLAGNPNSAPFRSMSRETGAVNSTAIPTEDDVALLARVQAGEEGAMASLYDRYSRLIYSVALRVLRDAASAEDVMQEVLMQVWRSPAGFASARGSLGGWLAVVARNRAIDLLRRRRPTDSVDDVPLASSFNLADEAERSSLMQRARGVILELPRDQRKALEMAFFDGLTHNEIAELTGTPLGTVKTRIRSALLSLRKAFPS
ncbi:MAG TPA: sigma-70 family RNA polymerase sigma factor [Acidobacteriaceae bacterium]|nr:sigma-70 family RNA polymerase sigma factor [Acidobacteriaceae bacterium]